MRKRKEYSKEEFVMNSDKKHNNEYDYSETVYVNCKEKVCILCHNKDGNGVEHGKFWITPDNHLQGRGCPICRYLKSGNKTRKKQSVFIDECNETHNCYYRYDRSIYTGNNKPICITCPVHGDFYQNAGSHLSGSGCPKCNQSKLEKEIYMFLQQENIRFETQKTFDWLVNKKNMFLDFYLPDYNVAIECQGRQHFENNDYFGGKIEYEKTISRDTIKFNLCNKNDIRIIYFSKEGLFKPNINYFSKIYTDKNEFLNTII